MARLECIAPGKTCCGPAGWWCESGSLHLALTWSLTTIKPRLPRLGQRVQATQLGFDQLKLPSPRLDQLDQRAQVYARVFPQKGFFFHRTMYLTTSCPPLPWARPEHLDMVDSGRKIYIQRPQNRHPPSDSQSDSEMSSLDIKIAGILTTWPIPRSHS